MDSLRDSVQREWGGRDVRGTGYSLAIGTGELGIRLEQGGVAGVITSRPKDAWGTIEIFETYNTRAPAIALSCEDYGLVFRLTENGDHPMLRLNLDAELLGEQPVFNTIAMIRGLREAGRIRGALGPLRFLGRLQRRHRQRHRHDHHARGDADPARRSTPTRSAPSWWATGPARRRARSAPRPSPRTTPRCSPGLQALFNQDNGTGRIVRMGGGGLPNAAEHITNWLNTSSDRVQGPGPVRRPRIPAPAAAATTSPSPATAPRPSASAP